MHVFAIDCDVNEDAVMLRAQGDVDSATIGDFVAGLADGLERASTHRARLLIVDLRAVTHFGSAGLNAVLDCHNRGAAADTAVRLVACNAQVVRPIEVTNLDHILDLYPTCCDALRQRRPEKQP